MEGPTPLTAVEELLVVLDSPGEPQNQRLELELSDDIDLPRLRGAVKAVSEDHPVLRATLRPWRWCDRSFEWERREAPDHDPVITLDVPTRADLDDVRDRLVSQPFGLERSHPFRLGVLTGAHGSSLLLVAHHAAIDAQAMVAMMRQVAARYADREPEPVVRHAPAATPGPGRPLRSAMPIIRILGGAMRSTARVAEDDAQPGSPGYHVHGVSLGRKATESLRPSRLAANARMGDLLLSAGISAIDQWNRERGRDGGRISLLHAVGLPTAPGAPVLGNAWMGTVVSVTPQRRRTHADLIASVARQRAANERRAVAAGLQSALGNGLAVPVWAKRAIPMVHPLTAHRLVESAALTSLGRHDPFDFGHGVVSRAMWFDGPVRLPKGLFIGAAFHDGALQLGFRSARAQIGREALRRFGELYVEMLRLLG